MIEMLLKSFAYMLLVALAYFLKIVGIFSTKDKDVLGKLLVYITLPCAFIANFKNFEKDNSMIYFFLIGFIVNIFMILVGYFISRKRDKNTTAMYMIECSGYNIGAFTTPFIASFLPGNALIAASIFDIGNCIMSVGGIYPLAKARVDEKKSSDNVIKDFFKKLFKSVPFDTYLIMLIISLAGIKLSSEINKIAEMIGAPSIIITMIMIGITIEVKIHREDILDILKILLIRYLIGFLIGIIIWISFDFSYLAKKVIMMCILAPVTSISPNYCNLCKCRASVYGAVSSLTVPISLIIFIVLMYAL